MRVAIIGFILSLAVYSYGQPDSVKSFNREFKLALAKNDCNGMWNALANHLELVMDETATMESCNTYIDFAELYISMWHEGTEKERIGNCVDRQLATSFIRQELAGALMTRGKIKHGMGDYYGCRDDLKRANELDPFDADILLVLGSINIEFGDKAEGCLQLSKAGEKGRTAAYDIIKEYCH